MIQNIKIKNFKSIVDLSIDIGYFNVLIGENGCGKSNILEAIGFASAASSDKLDNEFLGSRGLRVTNPDYMFSAFENIKRSEVIDLIFKSSNKSSTFKLVKDYDNSKKWIEKHRNDLRTSFNESLKETKSKIEELSKSSSTEKSITTEREKINESITNLEKLLDEIGGIQLNELSNYIIFSPEQSSLRKFEETTQIFPLGIHGEGLFKYLKELFEDDKNKETIKEIKENLYVLDWFEDFILPKDLLSNEFSIHIKDRYIDNSLKYFDQNSTNEGFLYLLFFFTLFSSKETPAFFAIDNIDSAFNPKLCRKLIKSLSALAKKYNKQVILTTHNPAVLDGLDLSDEGQRLFVVRRNDEGHTKAKQIPYKENREMNLSEIWTNGFIGGLPENF